MEKIKNIQSEKCCLLKFEYGESESGRIIEIKNISECTLEKIAKKDGKAIPVDAGNKYVGILKKMLGRMIFCS